MIVYIIFIFAFIFLNLDYKKTHPRLKKVFKFVSILLFIVLLGLRKDVGMDYSNYVDYFEDIHEFAYLEPGYNYINLFVSDLKLDVLFVFLIMAALSSFFIFMPFRKNNEFKYFPTALLIVVFGFMYLANGVRQGLAVCIFFFAYRFIKNKQLIFYLCCIAFASLFHISAVLLIPMYFIGTKLLSTWVYTSLFLLSVFFVLFLDASFILKFDFLGYTEGYRDSDMLNSSNLGPANLVTVFFNFIILVISLYKENNKFNPLLFNLFFIFVILFNMQMAVQIVTRISIYFQWFSFAWIPVLYYHNTKNYSKEGNVLLRDFIIVFYIAIALISYSAFDDYQFALNFNIV
jgi:hypothetical protein